MLSAKLWVLEPPWWTELLTIGKHVSSLFCQVDLDGKKRMLIDNILTNEGSAKCLVVWREALPHKISTIVVIDIQIRTWNISHALLLCLRSYVWQQRTQTVLQLYVSLKSQVKSRVCFKFEELGTVATLGRNSDLASYQASQLIAFTSCHMGQQPMLRKPQLLPRFMLP